MFNGKEKLVYDDLILKAWKCNPIWDHACKNMCNGVIHARNEWNVLIIVLISLECLKCRLVTIDIITEK
jgi:hypothetical protein